MEHLHSIYVTDLAICKVSSFNEWKAIATQSVNKYKHAHAHTYLTRIYLRLFIYF